MKKALIISTLVGLSLALSACSVPNRDEADAKLLDACVAAVKSMAPPEDTIEVQEKTFTTEETSVGSKLRLIDMHVYYTQNRGAIEERDISCAFEETSSVFGYSAKFYRLDLNGQKLGKFEDKFYGDLNELLKIDEAVSPLLR